MTHTYFNILCIDKRFDALTTNYFNAIGFTTNYYLGSTAGSCLPLGYQSYCSEVCNCICSHNPTTILCDPLNPDMELLKDSLVKNIEIAFSLEQINEIYLINHQDCGAIKAYLSCSGYPQTLGENNSLEIKINTQLLLFAKEYIKNKFPDVNVRLGLIDVNGSVSDFDEKYYSWDFIYRGPGTNPLGLWFGQ